VCFQWVTIPILKQRGRETKYLKLFPEIRSFVKVLTKGFLVLVSPTSSIGSALIRDSVIAVIRSIDLSLAGKVGNVELAAADSFYIR